MSTTTTTTIAAPVEAVLRTEPEPQAQTQPTQFPKPLTLGDSLKKFKQEESTPAIGQEFFDANLVDDFLNAENADEVLRDLAITSKLHPKVSCPVQS